MPAGKEAQPECISQRASSGRLNCSCSRSRDLTAINPVVPEMMKIAALPNIPYVFFVYLFDKVGQAVRLAPGADISAKILNITQGFSAAFENALPSVYPLDLLVGIVGAVIIRLIVYVKGKNAKKYRKGAEYGSARWSA